MLRRTLFGFAVAAMVLAAGACRREQPAPAEPIMPPMTDETVPPPAGPDPGVPADDDADDDPEVPDPTTPGPMPPDPGFYIEPAQQGGVDAGVAPILRDAGTGPRDAGAAVPRDATLPPPPRDGGPGLPPVPGSDGGPPPNPGPPPAPSPVPPTPIGDAEGMPG